jgi:hypothetical protein
MNLRQIYEKLVREAESRYEKIDEVSENRLRQQAWMMRDRMMFESSLSVSQSPSAGAGGGGRILSQSNDYIDPDYIDPDYFM